MYSVLSLFPDLYIFSFLAPTILRIGVSIIIFRAGLGLFRKVRGITEQEVSVARAISVVEIIGAISLFLGIYTQAAAILLVIAIAGRSFTLWNELPRSERELSTLICVILLSLLITGPGALAIDLPL